MTGVAVAALGAAAWLGVGPSRARRLHRKNIEERGRLLERARASAARTAVDAERARITRELHDIVSHNVSVMVVQAGAARQVLAIEPDGAAEAMLAVEAAGRDTVTELRHLLGLLAPSASGEGGAGAAAEPSAAQRTDRPDRPGSADECAEARRQGEGRGEDAVREHLATRGSAEQRPERVVRRRPVGDRSATGIPNHAKGDGTGRGLLGLAERVAVYGGDLDAQRGLGGGYRVRARIPLNKPGQDAWLVKL